MISDRTEKRLKITESIFDQICLLAINNDISGINTLLATGHRIDFRQNIYSPVMWLAKQGEEQAVTLLIKNYHASVLEAVCGYVLVDLHILAGLPDQVNDLPEELVNTGFTNDIGITALVLGTLLLNQTFSKSHFDLSGKLPGHSISDFVRNELTYVRANIKSALNTILYNEWYLIAYALAYTAMNASVEWIRQITNQSFSQHPHEAIVRGYVSGGHIDLANAYMDKEKYALDHMAFWYAKDGNFENAGDLLRRGANELLVIDGCRAGGYLMDANEITRLLTIANNDEFRRLITTHLMQTNQQCKHPINQVDMNKVAKLRKIMHEYRISYDGAQALLIPGVREWLLQYRQICSNRLTSDKIMIFALPVEIYFIITSLTLSLSHHETEKLFSAVHKTLFANIVTSLTQKYTSGLFANKADYFTEIENAEERYAARLKLN